MTDFEPETERDAPAIIKYEGIPNPPTQQSVWRRFLQTVFPFMKRGGKWAEHGADLARSYAEAEVADRNNRALKTAAEAAEISARADLARNEAAKVFSDEVDAIFADRDLPESARMLKLAKLFEANPDLAAQVERVTDLLNRLHLQYGVTVHFQNPAALEQEPHTETHD